MDLPHDSEPGEFGNDTWEKDSEAYTGNTGVWAQMSVDEELGLVYLPVEMPTGDYYGGHRPGDGLFGESLVAVDLKTGKRKWHYQFVQHGIWDWDLPCAPILADVTIDGRHAQGRGAADQAGLALRVRSRDRRAGLADRGARGRAVRRAEEKSCPTQPFVTKPPAFERQGVSIDDLIDFTPELRAEAVKLVSRYKIGPIFTPPVVSKWDGPLATLMLPNATGGANWQGGSFDPETGTFYIFSNTKVSRSGSCPARTSGKRSDMAYVRGQAVESRRTRRRRPVPTTVQGLPLIKPPYGRITAIDLNKGELLWQIAHGETPDNVRNHPALKGLTIPRTGRQGRIGTLVTKSLVIAGEGGFFTLPDGRRGAMLRAYDKRTGQEAGAVYMPAPQTGSPMTYMLNGRQYIVVAISGAEFSGRADRVPPAGVMRCGSEVRCTATPLGGSCSFDPPTHKIDPMKRLVLALACLRRQRSLVAQGPERFSGPSSQTLAQLTGDYWEWRLAVQPETATRVGRTDHNDRWRDWSKAARDRLRKDREEFLQKAMYLSPGNLNRDRPRDRRS